MATRGRPFEPGNNFGRGRPRGSRNKTTMLAQELLNSHAEPIVRKVLLMAFQGDMKALQLCIERVIPVLRGLPVKLGALPMRTLADLNKTSERLLKKVAAGQLTTAQGQAVLDLIEYRRRIIETVELEKSMSLLETKS
jgi:hypothetical protein